MNWFVNELSLNGQYGSPAEFLQELEVLLKLRRQYKAFRDNFYCSRRISLMPITGDLNFHQAVLLQAEKIVKALILEWINKTGPYLEDHRMLIEDDYFECQSCDVTDLGLGEASRRLILNVHSEAVSFSNGGFEFSPIEVQHGLSESPISVQRIINHWTHISLLRSIQSCGSGPANWAQLLNILSEKFLFLDFIPNCINSLEFEPFNPYAAQRFIELSSVLNEIVGCLFMSDALEKNDRNALEVFFGPDFDQDNQQDERKAKDAIIMARYFELWGMHFGGNKAWFSDESDTNKNEFRRDLSFLVEGFSDKIFCPWHGKIKTPQYRMHYEWPPRTGNKLIVCYLGPKITKA